MINQNTLVLAALATTLPALALKLTVANACPDPIDFYINSQIAGHLAVNGTNSTVYPDNWGGLVYTSAYGGSPTASGSTAAGIIGGNNWYYILQDPKHFNTAVSIAVNQTESNGFCVTDSCLTATCPNSFTTPPTHTTGVPGSTPPDPPIYGCKATQPLEYTVTFCSNNAGDAPAPKTTVALKPGNSSNKCLDVRGAIFENGTPVQIYDCNGTGAQKWVIKNGETKVQLAGTNFCLDAGSSPQNGVGLKIWQCYDNLPAQDWYYTADNRLALTNQGQCVDLPNGDSTNGVQVQIWKCTDNDNYQVWNF